MKRKVLLILCSIFISVGFVSAQGKKKTVTNADLEGFKQKRLQAEKDLRENYAKLGFPSPEELEKQRRASDLERERLSEKLRRERLEREQIYYEQELLQSQNSPDVYVIENSNGYRSSYPFIGAGYYSRPRYGGGGRIRNSNPYFKNGYGPVGGGFFGPRINPFQNNRNYPNRKHPFTTNPVRRQDGRIGNPR